MALQPLPCLKNNNGHNRCVFVLQTVATALTCNTRNIHASFTDNAKTKNGPQCAALRMLAT